MIFSFFCVKVASDIIKDYEKSKFFLEPDNQKLYRDNFKQDMPVVLRNMPTKTKESIDYMLYKQKNNKNKTIYVPNINTIDNINIKELREIRDFLLKNQEYAKYYPEEKPKIKILAPDK